MLFNFRASEKLFKTQSWLSICLSCPFFSENVNKPELQGCMPLTKAIVIYGAIWPKSIIQWNYCSEHIVQSKLLDNIRHCATTCLTSVIHLLMYIVEPLRVRKTVSVLSFPFFSVSFFRGIIEESFDYGLSIPHKMFRYICPESWLFMTMICFEKTTE